MSKKLVEEKQSKQGRSNYDGQQHETLRLGTPESKLAEKVVDARENNSVQHLALKKRTQSTGEPEAAPRVDSIGSE